MIGHLLDRRHPDVCEAVRRLREGRTTDLTHYVRALDWASDELAKKDNVLTAEEWREVMLAKASRRARA